MKKFIVSALVVCLAIPALAAVFDGLEPIEPDVAHRFGKILADEADKISKPQIKIAADPDKAVGLHVPQKVGVLVVPQKELKESEELAEKFKTEKGAALAYLFLYNLTPVIDGQPVDASRLRSVELADDNGGKHTVFVLLLAVRQLTDDDYRLQAYGHEEKPLVDAKFSQSAGPGTEPVAVEIKDVNEATHTGKLVLTVFGKYQAGFTCGHKADQ
jgi:hypothetical protein